MPTPTGSTSSSRWASRNRPARRVLLVLAAVTSAAVALTSLTGYTLLTQIEDRVQRVEVFKGINDTPHRTTDKAENYLIVGSDSRAGLSRGQVRDLHLGRAAGRRSDTMILAHVSKQHDKVSMVSLPRDSLVQIPEHRDATGELVPASRNKLNAAYSLGGGQLAVRTVQNATGVAIDHYVEVNFAGFIDVVDALGSVEVCVTRPVYDKDSGLDLPAGRHDLDGRDSLSYVRARHLDATGDLGRIERQQRFVGAMMREALSAGTLFNPVRLQNVLDASLQTVRTDPDLDRANMVELASRLRGLDPEHVQFVTVPVADPDYRGEEALGSTVRWDPAAAGELFARIRDDQPVTGPAEAEPGLEAGVGPGSEVGVGAGREPGTRAAAEPAGTPPAPARSAADRACD